MTAVYHGRGEKMEGYELYRLSDEEIQHVGVKGMKWGKRKSRSAYMTAVDKHEAKTKANRQKVADHKAREKAQGKAVAKAIGTKYMDASRSHEAKTTAKRDAKKAASKAKYEQEKADFANAKKTVKQAGKNYIERNKAKEVARLEKRVETKAKFKADTKTTINKFRDAAAMMEEEKQTKRAARKQLAKARAKDLSEKLSKGLNIAVAVNDVYGDISPTGLKNHFANAEQLEKYGIEYNP